MDVRRWLKGNLHTHTVRSDGDATVAQAAAFYAERDYDFLAITDHNRFLRPDEIPPAPPTPGFVLIGGSELSGKAMLTMGVPAPVDVCCLGGFAADPSALAGLVPRTPAQAVRARVAAARAAGGLPMVCHPCWKWALAADDLLTLDGEFLLEVFNASRDCNNWPAGGGDSPEEIWSTLLSAGRKVWATATDDAHRLAQPTVPAIDGGAVAWVRVDAAGRTEPAILQSLAAGKFYSSTGVELEELDLGPETYRVQIAPIKDRRYTTVFLGRDNRELARAFGLSAAWPIRGDEGFVRARIEDTAGCRCWTPPQFV